jgi:eukaryotic-like serine/threonine-protein kinase
MKQLGRYEIIDELGRGAMGVVYKARDPLIDRVLAIKTVGLDLSRDEAQAFEQRFYREAKSAGRLNHANIVTIHDVGRSDSIAYIAMEFLQGRSLRGIIDSGVVLPPEKVAEITAQVADGLAFAHDNGIVHRDIKPPNIMVLDSGLVKITDFGIALLPSGSRTLSGTVFGSPKYMSPEQVVGRKVDGRADIFSLGAVLYELLTGFAPFFGGDLDGLFYQVINEMPVAPSERNKALPPAFDYIVAKAMAKHPDDRYQNGRAMAADLRNFRHLEPPSVVPQPRTLERRAIRRRKGDPVPAAGAAATGPASFPPAGERPWWQERKLLAYAAATGLAIIVAGIVGGAWLAERANRPPQPSEIIALSTDKPPAIVPPGEKEALAKPASDSEPSPPAKSADEPRPVPSMAVAPAQPTAAKPMAKLGIAVAPWGEIYVDGHKRGASPPLTELRLAPGKHRVEIRNPAFSPYVEMVDLEANTYFRIRHKFQ